MTPIHKVLFGIGLENGVSQVSELLTAALLGPRTMEQFTSVQPALELKLNAETLAALDKIFPGPGEAPKAYSW